MTWFLILVNAGIFLYLYFNHPSSLFYLDYGLVSSKLGMPGDIVPFYEKIYPFFTYMFLHGGWFHIIINIYFLLIFGAAVEGRLGHGRFLAAYIVFGLVAAITEVFFSPVSGFPVIGASGAVAGVMGAYIVFFPSSKIKTLIIIIIFITIVNIPAVVFIGLWFLVQLASGIFSSSIEAEGGVAWWAHIGGFAAGIVAALAARLTGDLNKKSETNSGFSGL